MPAKVPDIDLDDLVQRYMAGETHKALAARYGVSVTTIYWKLRDNAVPLRGPQRRVLPQSAIIAYENGVPLAQIQADLGINRHALMHALRKASVPVRKKGDWTIDTERIIGRYQAGESVTRIANTLGISNSAVVDRLKAHGISTRTHHIAHTLDWDAICVDYMAGQSEKALSDAHGVSRTVIRRILTERNIPIRDSLAANRLMASARTPEQRRQYASGAHAAARGKRHSWERRCAIARTREAHPTNVSPAETLLALWLRDRGVETIAQKAIGPYNADLTVGSVAVEVLGGGFHNSGSHAARAADRTRYLLNDGWNLIFVCVAPKVGPWGKSHPLTEGAADYIVTFVELASSNPAMRGEYRVIWGTSEEVPPSSPYFHKGAGIPALSAGESLWAANDGARREA